MSVTKEGSDLAGKICEDIFREAFTKFLKRCTNPCYPPSRIIRSGESRWCRLPKSKKVQYIINAINARKRRMRNKCKRKRKPPKCSLPEETLMESELEVPGPMDGDSSLVDACCPKKKKKRCPKKRKPSCPKKRKRSCPKKRKPSCPKKKPAYCRFLKVKGG